MAPTPHTVPPVRPPRKPGSSWRGRLRRAARGLGCAAGLILLLGAIAGPERHQPCRLCTLLDLYRTELEISPRPSAFRYAETNAGDCTCAAGRHPPATVWPELLLDSVLPAKPAPQFRPRVRGGTR